MRKTIIFLFLPGSVCFAVGTAFIFMSQQMRNVQGYRADIAAQEQTHTQAFVPGPWINAETPLVHSPVLRTAIESNSQTAETVLLREELAAKTARIAELEAQSNSLAASLADCESYHGEALAYQFLDSPEAQAFSVEDRHLVASNLVEKLGQIPFPDQISAWLTAYKRFTERFTAWNAKWLAIGNDFNHPDWPMLNTEHDDIFREWGDALKVIDPEWVEKLQ